MNQTKGETVKQYRHFGIYENPLRVSSAMGSAPRRYALVPVIRNPGGRFQVYDRLESKYFKMAGSESSCCYKIEIEAGQILPDTEGARPWNPRSWHDAEDIAAALEKLRLEVGIDGLGHLPVFLLPDGRWSETWSEAA